MTVRDVFCTSLAALAQQGKGISDAEFTDACYRAASEHGFDPAYLAQHLDIGAASFDRWIAGANLPQPLIRGRILLAIMHSLKQA